MQFRSAKSSLGWRSSLAIIGIWCCSAPVALGATVTVTPEAPYSITNDSTYTNSVFYAAIPISSPTPLMDEVDGGKFKNFDFSQSAATDTARTHILLFRIKTDTTAAEDRVINIKIHGKEFFVPIASFGGEDCGGRAECLGQQPPLWTNNTNYYFTAKYKTNDERVIGIYLQDLCIAAHKQGAVAADVPICDIPSSQSTSGSVKYPIPTNTLTTIALQITVGTKKKDSAAGSPEIDGTSSEKLTLHIEGSPPSLDCSSPSTFLDDIYFPGDGEILVEAWKFQATPTTAPLDRVIVAGKDGADPSTTTLENIMGRLPINGSQSVTGFTNTTTGADHLYNIWFSVRDSAGVIAPFNSNCKLTGVATSKIQGFLTQSNCFIATAAFRSMDAAPVELLREFRDKVLLKSRYGRIFVNWYYNWSPGAATWLIENPQFRFPVLLALVPLELFAWLVLHSSLTLCLLISVGAALVLRNRT